jgi:hypothetical protein
MTSISRGLYKAYPYLFTLVILYQHFIKDDSKSYFFSIYCQQCQSHYSNPKNDTAHLDPVHAPGIGAGVADLDHAEALGDEPVVAVLDLLALESVHPPALKVVKVLRVHIIDHTQGPWASKVDDKRFYNTQNISCAKNMRQF